MFDDLRQQADDTSFEEEEQDAYSYKDQARKSTRSFLGMTSLQRFVVAMMLLLMTCMLSVFCLLVTGKIFIPGL